MLSLAGCPLLVVRRGRVSGRRALRWPSLSSCQRRDGGFPAAVSVANSSTGPIGVLCRELTETTTGHVLACLYAADRYHHLEAEVRPNTSAGRVVISDRYIPSGLVMQRFDGIDPAFLWQLNAEADRPDLAVLLEADPEVISERLTERGPHNRFQLSPGSSHAGVHFYRQATERLIQAGFDVLRVDCNQGPREKCAAFIRDRLTTFFAPAWE